MNSLAWLAWLIAAVVVAGLTTNPLYLLLALLAAALVFLACRSDTPLARAYRLFFLAGMALWVGYVVFSVVTVGGARGRTVLATLPTAQNIFVLAMRYDRRVTLARDAIFVSTVLSVPAIVVAAALLT